MQESSNIDQSLWRLRLSWKIVVFGYAGLSVASWGILSQGADVSTANGRHLLAGAIANLAVVAMGIMVTVTAFRQAKRWAWFVNLIPVLYGIPIICLDSYYVGFWTGTVLPQVFGAVVFLFGLFLPVDIFWQSQKRGNAAKQTA